MRSAYYEVARSYWRHAVRSKLFFVFCIAPQLFLMFMLLFALPGRLGIEHLMPATCVIGFLGGLMWVHFREQVVDPRKRVLPGFIAPQVVVFSLLLSLLVIIWPALLIVSTGTHSTGFLTFAAGLVAFLGLWTLYPKPILILPAVAVGFLFMSGVAFGPLQRLIGGDHERLMRLLFPLLLGVIGWIIVRISRLTEDDAAYHHQFRYGIADIRPRMTGDANRAWIDAQRRQLFFLGGGHRRAFLPTSPGIWSGARRWLSLAGGNYWFLVALVTLQVAALELLSRIHTTEREEAHFPLMAIWLILLPAALVVPQWVRLWRYLEQELLRPIDRRTFIKQLGLAIAIDTLRAWCIVVAIAVADRLVFAIGTPDWPSLAAGIATSLGIAILGYGTSLWVMRYRSLGGVVAVAVLMVAGSQAVIIMIDQQFAIFRPYALGATLLLVCLGMAASWDAYRRWLLTDFG